MKFSTVQVMSHPRSGSHYLACLIDSNFFNGNNYIQYYGSHALHKPGTIRNHPHVGYLYVWRNTEDTIKSLFKIRKRFGLDEDNFETFKETKCKDMFNQHVQSTVTVNTIHSTRIVHTIEPMLSTIQMTPLEYITNHKKHWRSLADSFHNIKVVCYDDLLNNFQPTMLSISQFMESSNTQFHNVQQVGWTPK